MEKQKVMLINTVPAVTELRKVPGFDPLRFLRKKAATEAGMPEVTLDLRYKRLWFRLACPNGRMLLNPLRITDQMAICEARVFLNRDDELPITNYTATVLEKDAPDGGYVKAAQDEALNVALDNAGFGIQFCDVSGEPEHESAPAADVQREVFKQPAAAPAAAPEMQQPKTTSVTAPAPTPTDGLAQAGTPASETKQGEVAQELPVTDHADKGGDAQTPAQEPDQAAPAGTASDAAALLQTLSGQNGASKGSADVAEESAPADDEPVEEQPQYTEDMSVDEIRELMTVDEAGKVVVPFGTCKGWTLAQVADQRPPSLKWLAYGCDTCGNILKAAALTLLDDGLQQKAG